MASKRKSSQSLAPIEAIRLENCSCILNDLSEGARTPGHFTINVEASTKVPEDPNNRVIVQLTVHINGFKIEESSVNSPVTEALQHLEPVFKLSMGFHAEHKIKDVDNYDKQFHIDNSLPYVSRLFVAKRDTLQNMLVEMGYAFVPLPYLIDNINLDDITVEIAKSKDK